MKTELLPILGFIAAVGFSAQAQEAAPAPEVSDKKPEAAAPARIPAGKSAAELEQLFITTLTKATLGGRWCLIKDGKMGQEREESYSIQSVKRNAPDSDFWTVNAGFKYGGLEIAIPVPMQVKWAGDTPVMIVDNIGIPGGNKYSARVMIYGKTYVGTWTGGDHGGLLHGVITNEAPPEEPK